MHFNDYIDFIVFEISAASRFLVSRNTLNMPSSSLSLDYSFI